MSEILTTNKNDFLSDANSLKKYYKFRKAAQEAVLPILQDMGETASPADIAPEKILRPLSQSITGALTSLVGDFPELETLIGQHRTEALGSPRKEKDDKKITVAEPPADYGGDGAGQDSGNRPDADPEGEKSAPTPAGIADDSKSKTVRTKTAGLKLVLGEIDNENGAILGRVMEDTLTVNTAHPAWKKAKQKGLEEYHIVITVASVLSQFLESEKNPRDFLNRLLIAWAAESEKMAGKLF